MSEGRVCGIYFISITEIYANYKSVKTFHLTYMMALKLDSHTSDYAQIAIRKQGVEFIG